MGRAEDEGKAEGPQDGVSEAEQSVRPDPPAATARPYLWEQAGLLEALGPLARF